MCTLCVCACVYSRVCISSDMINCDPFPVNKDTWGWAWMSLRKDLSQYEFMGTILSESSSILCQTLWTNLERRDGGNWWRPPNHRLHRLRTQWAGGKEAKASQGLSVVTWKRKQEGDWWERLKTRVVCTSSRLFGFHLNHNVKTSAWHTRRVSKI